MNSIHNLLPLYAELEILIRRIMTSLCSDTCAMCTVCCCRADICEEAVESAFLSRLLTRQGLAANDMDDRYGWLDLNGCSLEYGRPPICYAYFCDQLLARLPDEETVLAATVLGKLLHHVGEHSLGELHLVDIKADTVLDKVNTEQLFKQLDEARAAFQVIDEFFKTGRLSLSDREVLAVITTADL